MENPRAEKRGEVPDSRVQKTLEPRFAFRGMLA
jgi:hypothetical protein